MGKNEKSFSLLLLLLHLLLLLLYIFRCWLDEMRRFLLKYDRKENRSTTRPCKKKKNTVTPPPRYPRTSIPLSASCLIRISPLATLLTICLSFFFLKPASSAECGPWIWNTLKISLLPSLPPSIRRFAFPCWLRSLAWGSLKQGKRVEWQSPSLTFRPHWTLYHALQAHFLPGVSWWLLGPKPHAMSEHV